MGRPVDRVTSGWTDRYLGVLATSVVAAAAGMVVALRGPPFNVLGGLIVLAVLAVTVRLSTFGGIVVGVVAAAALVAAQQAAGAWTDDVFWPSLAATVALIGLGWVTAWSGGTLRERTAKDLAAGEGPAGPAFGSLGLLTSDVAMSVLDEEVLRARRHQRPLALMLLTVHITATGLSEAARRAATRSVARLVENLLRDTDVPFALAEHEIGAILPETTADGAWEFVGRVVEAIDSASFTVRETGQRLRFADCGEISVRLAGLEPEDRGADDLLSHVRDPAGGEPLAGPVTGGGEQDR